MCSTCVRAAPLQITVRCRARARRCAPVAAPFGGAAPRLSLGRRAANREFVIGKALCIAEHWVVNHEATMTDVK